MIELVDVTKLYDNQKGINNINLNLSNGICGLLGPNGSGKTTLLNLIVGLLRPDSGTISINGIDINNDSRVEMVNRIPQ